MIKTLIYNIAQKIVYRYRANQESYLAYLRKCGVSVGERVNLFAPSNTMIDVTVPHLLTIGDDVQITSGVNILTHDFAWSVLKRKYGEVIGGQGKVVIGNNVFIGTNAIILKNTVIGDNVIIGANSVVSGIIPSDTVVAGCPAKVIMTLDEYYNKRKNLQLKELSQVVSCYRDRNKKDPGMDDLSEYFWCFTNNQSDLSERCRMQMENCGNAEMSYEIFEKHTPEYAGIEEMLNSINK